MQKRLVLEDPKRTRLIVPETYKDKKKKPPTENGCTSWVIENEDYDVVGVFKGDVPPNAYLHTRTGYHPHVYIEGRVGEGAEIPSRECEILSAHSLGKDAQMGGRILILGDEPLSRLSTNFKSRWEWPLVLVVPENQRALVFNHVMDAIDNYRFPKVTEEVDEHVKALYSIMEECKVYEYRIFSKGRCVATSPG